MGSTKPWAVILIIIMTALTSSAQVCYKLASDPATHLSLISVLLDPWLWLGLALYGVGFILLNIAFHGGEVSVLYPIIATSYIWVAIISYYFFGEVLHTLKVLGILAIVIGVALISGASSSSNSNEVPN